MKRWQLPIVLLMIGAITCSNLTIARAAVYPRNILEIYALQNGKILDDCVKKGSNYEIMMKTVSTVSGFDGAIPQTWLLNSLHYDQQNNLLGSGVVKYNLSNKKVYEEKSGSLSLRFDSFNVNGNKVFVNQEAPGQNGYLKYSGRTIINGYVTNNLSASVIVKICPDEDLPNNQDTNTASPIETVDKIVLKTIPASTVTENSLETPKVIPPAAPLTGGTPECPDLSSEIAKLKNWIFMLAAGLLLLLIILAILIFLFSRKEEEEEKRRKQLNQSPIKIIGELPENQTVVNMNQTQPLDSASVYRQDQPSEDPSRGKILY